MDPIVSTATESALQFGGGVVKRHVGYFCNYSDKFDEVKRYVEMLENARRRVQNQVNEAEMNAEEIEDEVKHWLKQVDDKIKEYTIFIGDGDHAKTRCSIGFFPNNLQLRYRLGRKATKMAEENKAEELWKQNFEKVSHRVGPSMDAALLSNVEYESFASRKKTMEKIMQALEDSTVSMIGVHGVGGVGKTTLVKEVAKKAQENKLFNMVIMANITRNPEIKKIQGQIAEMLGMRLEEESEIVRADRLRKRLKKEKENTLIILDDFWDGLDLNRLGIPCGEDDDGNQRDVKDITDFGYNKIEKEKLSADYNKMTKEKLSGDYNKMQKEKLSGDHKGCKILLTSRSKEVLCNQMDVKERSTFSVGVIDEKEAETLLKKVAGIHGKNPVYDVKASEIAKMCAGLPIALVSIGRALKNKSSFVWEDVSRQIKRQNFTGGQESIEFSAKLSYDHLKDEQLKYIFLHCARMGNDPLIMDLVKFCIGLGLLHGVYTIKEARSRVNVLIGELKESSLLVDSYSNDRFNMHDIVRDVAISISSKENHVFFMKNDLLDEWPHKDQLESYTAIFLHYCHIKDELPESIYCPRLKVFHLDSKDDFLKIPDNFFKEMTELRVLILTGVNLSYLPSSIRCLKKLRMLCLERCTLGENLSIIGELRKLRILTFSGSNIESLPIELAHLDMLQLFDLSNCSKLRVIPSNFISRLNSLEELYMRENLILWEASLSELRHLNQLRTLEIHISSVAHFPENLFFDKLDSYKIVIGEFNMLLVGEFKIPDKYEALKFLALNLEDGMNIHSKKWVKMLFKRVENLLLGELNDVRDVFYELNVEGFPHLKHLSIVNNFGMQYIINSMEQLHPLQAFPKLESMCLYKMENLEKLCCNKLTRDSFCNLKIIKIKTCGKLENLFSFTMLKLLTMLETIEVCNCDSLKEIVFVERQTHVINNVKDDKIEFPQLRYLTLQSLPAFMCLYTNDKMSSFSQSWENHLPKNDKENTSKVEQGSSACLSLFNEKVLIPKLEWLELSSMNITKIWSDQSLHCFQNLLTLNVTNCGNINYLTYLEVVNCITLKNLMTSSTAKSLIQLTFMKVSFEYSKHLTLADYPEMKEVRHGKPAFPDNFFHSLKILILNWLFKRDIVIPSHVLPYLKSLEELHVNNCNAVQAIFDINHTEAMKTKGMVLHLKKLNLDELPNLKRVWNKNPQGIVNFPNLQEVVVQDCGSLTTLIPSSLAKNLMKLKIIQILKCDKLVEIVGKEDAMEFGLTENSVVFQFPCLSLLVLRQLPQLECFYPGRYHLECPILEGLDVSYCGKLKLFTTELNSNQDALAKDQVSTSIDQQHQPLFMVQKVIPKLKRLALNERNIILLNDAHSPLNHLHKLKLCFEDGNEKASLPFDFLHKVPNLTSLTVKKCIGLKEIFPSQKLQIPDGTLVGLKRIILNKLRELNLIGLEHPWVKPYSEKLEKLNVSKCSRLVKLVHSVVSFINLKELSVDSCKRMEYLFTISTAKSLVHLEYLFIFDCESIEEIITKEDDDGSDHEIIVFERLVMLMLSSLPSLVCFYSGNTTLQFSYLQAAIITQCPNMKTFSRGVINAPMFSWVRGSFVDIDFHFHDDLNTTIEKLYHENLVNSARDIRLLKFGDHPQLEEIWLGIVPIPSDNCFNNLTSLIVVECESLSNVIPFYLLPFLCNLKEMEVSKCQSVKAIFDVKGIRADNMKPASILSLPLKKLVLNQLPNLEHIWNKDPDEFLNLQGLQEVSIFNCQSLKSLFYTSVTNHLVTLDVKYCERLEEIVVGDEVALEGETKKLIFHCLISLTLWGLPELKYFYPEKHSLEWPILKYLDVYHCDKLKLFTIEPSNCQDAHLDDQLGVSIDKQATFDVEKVFPKLELLSIKKEDAMMISQGQIQVIPNLEHQLSTKEDIMIGQKQYATNVAYLLQNLKFLKLQCFHEDDKSNIFSSGLLEKIPNIETLEVVCSSLSEIFSFQRPIANSTKIFSKLKGLRLNCLHKLNSIGLEHSWVDPLPKTLQTLDVLYCSCLKILVPSTVSFSNLMYLNVGGCHGLIYLFTPSNAKSLGLLKNMTIWDCHAIQEIVSKESDHEPIAEEITFQQLSFLSLQTLPSIIGFYTGTSKLKFPSLDQVILMDCPLMKYSYDHIRHQFISFKQIMEEQEGLYEESIKS
ncbi:P-loop containing nucleoside triphosphate hydrolase [Sesbania bispinosa]|nr:P-loop containing nucleoside triphosphate hydrolase [Sesbania bispinosa]